MTKVTSIECKRASDSRPLVGVIGGLGTRATLSFIQKIVSLTPVEREQDHLPMVIYNASGTPDRNQSIVNGDVACGDALVDVARALERAGCEYLVMPCNAAHYYADMICTAVDVPFLSMIEATCDQISRSISNNDVVGILCSDGTRHARLYEKALAKYGITAISPDDTDQRRCMESIYTAKENRITTKTREDMQRICADLERRGANILIAACTEIPLLVTEDDIGVAIVDTSDVLAQLCISTTADEIVRSRGRKIDRERRIFE